MNIVRRMFGSSGTAERDANAPVYWTERAITPDGRVIVNAQTVTQIPEVYACLQVLSQTIGMLPLIMYRKDRNGTKRRDDEHPIADLLHHRPNPDTTAYELRAQMTWDLCLHRNAFAEIKEGRRGPVDELHRIDPTLVWVVVSPGGGDYVYEVRDRRGMKRQIDRDHMFHLKSPPFTTDGLLGRSLIEDGAKTFGRALAIQDYAARFFENDATPGGIIEVPGKMTPELIKEFREKWRELLGGRNRHSAHVLDAGAKWNKSDVANDKAQFIETYREVALQCIRFLRVPPHKIGILDKATFSNIEQQSLEFVTDACMPLITAWEQGIRRDLITRPDWYAEHNIDGLLRGDIKSRYEAYKIGRDGGWLSADDIRGKENMNDLPDGQGKTYLQPLNMQTADGQQRAQPAAFAAMVDQAVAAHFEGLKQIEGTPCDTSTS